MFPSRNPFITWQRNMLRLGVRNRRKALHLFMRLMARFPSMVATNLQAGWRLLKWQTGFYAEFPDLTVHLDDIRAAREPGHLRR